MNAREIRENNEAIKRLQRNRIMHKARVKRQRTALLLALSMIGCGLFAYAKGDDRAEALEVNTVEEVIVIEEPEVIIVEEEVVEVEVIGESSNDAVEEPQPSSIYSEEDVKALACLVYGEAEGESYEGKLAVATVVVNRAEHWNKRLFGGPTIDGVIFQSGQFDGVARYDIIDYNSEAYAESYQAAKEVLLNNHRCLGRHVLYFFNPRTSTDTGFMASIERVTTIGNHAFGYSMIDVEKGVMPSIAYQCD